MRHRIAVLIVLTCVAGRADAQTERYELGRRLRQFEADWEVADDAGRKRALAVLKPVSRQFLTFQLSEAGRTLDDARFALWADPVPDAERWAAGLQAVPTTRLIDASATELAVEVKPFYRVGDRPAGVHFATDATRPAPLDKLPLSLKVPLRPLPAGESDGRFVVVSFSVGGRYVGRAEFFLSRVADLKGRLAKLAAAGGPDGPERATAADRAKEFAALAAGEVPETDLPVATLMEEAEGWADGKPYFTPANPGRHWLTLPVGGRPTHWRVSVPLDLDAKTPVPLVVALHGAGGSENLFFDGYGGGCVVEACEERGWLVAAPRVGFVPFGGPPPLEDSINELAKRYPIDRKRVFLVGHSMGAAHSVEAVQRWPGTFASVAVLGGGGRVRKPEAFAGVRTFVGVGTEDFARGGAIALHKALPGAALKEYAGVEHLTVVRAAVADVFKLFDNGSGD